MSKPLMTIAELSKRWDCEAEEIISRYILLQYFKPDEIAAFAEGQFENEAPRYTLLFLTTEDNLNRYFITRAAFEITLEGDHKNSESAPVRPGRITYTFSGRPEDVRIPLKAVERVEAEWSIGKPLTDRGVGGYLEVISALTQALAAEIPKLKKNGRIIVGYTKDKDSGVVRHLIENEFTTLKAEAIRTKISPALKRFPPRVKE